MKRKDELKESTVNVILSAQRHKFERSRDEIDFYKLESAYTMFRKNIFELKKAAKRLSAMRGEDEDDFMRDIAYIHKEMDNVLSMQN